MFILFNPAEIRADQKARRTRSFRAGVQSAPAEGRFWPSMYWRRWVGRQRDRSKIMAQTGHDRVAFAQPCSAETLRRARRALAEGRLGGGEAGNRHPERRTRHIVEPDLVAECDRRRIAAVFAANAELGVAARLASTFGGDLDQLADAITIDRHERVDRKNPQARICAEEARGVIAADAEGSLG